MGVIVNFNASIENWRAFVNGLNESLSDDVVIDFQFGDPVMHEMFCSVIFLLGQKKFMLETVLAGPGTQCLLVNSETLKDRFVEIVAKFEKNAKNFGLIPWLGQVVRLTEMGYNIRAEVPRAIDSAWLSRYRKTDIPIRIEVVQPAVEVERKRGLRKAVRSCAGEHTVIWQDGKFYPCYWCVVGAISHPVYNYGKLGDAFEKVGKQECHLRECPYER